MSVWFDMTIFWVICQERSVLTRDQIRNECHFALHLPLYTQQVSLKEGIKSSRALCLRQCIALYQFHFALANPYPCLYVSMASQCLFNQQASM